jgi:hypothetical protein
MPHPFVYDTILLLLMENSVPWMYIYDIFFCSVSLVCSAEQAGRGPLSG